MTLYEVLGVTPTAPAAEIRRAYVDLARLHHPDRHGGDAATMRAVNEAWATLGDQERRARYDLSLQAPAASTPLTPEPVTGLSDEEDLLADLADDTPLGGRVVLGPWVSLVPVAVFAASLGALGIGLLFRSTSALAGAITLFLLSCTLFLVAPFVALLSSRRGNR